MTQAISRERVLHKLLERQAVKYGGGTYMSYRDQEFSFAEVDGLAGQVACSLQKLGIGKGDKVAILMDNCPEMVFLGFGLSKLGAIQVPINTAHKGEILTYMLDQSDSQILVIHNHFVERLASLLANVPKIRCVVTLDGTGSAQEAGQSDSVSGEDQIRAHGKQLIKWPELINNDGTYLSADVVWSDPCMILYTSGTTGLSKGVLIPQNLLFSMPERYLNTELVVGENDIIHNSLPLYHVHAWHTGVNLALMCGARVVMFEKFSASKFWDETKQYGCNYAVSSGGMLAILFNADPRPDDADNPVQVFVGWPASPDYCAAFEKRFGVSILEFYGSTELSAPIINQIGNRKIGSCGTMHPDYTVKIVDDGGAEAGINTPGEILVRPNKPYIMMLEYYKMPEKTVEAWKDLWFHTGDNGFFDQDGFVFFSDRKKDSIRRRGENISSFELENVLNSHPAVQESAAFGVESAIGEDDVMACITLRPGHSAASEEIIAFCEERLAYFMVPRYVRFRDNLPKTATLRVEKYKLRNEGITPDTWDREKAGYKLKRSV